MLISNLFKNNINPLAKFIIKIGLLIAILSVFIGVLVATNLLVAQLIERDKNIMRTYTEVYKYYLNPNNESNYENPLLFLDAITQSISFPIISTDMNDEPLQSYAEFSLNVDLSQYKTKAEQKQYLLGLIKKFKKNYEPIVVYLPDGKILNKFYYSHSQFVDYLRFFPLASLLLVSIIIVIGYFAFNSARKNEQSKVWVGMARETAHQIGTPLSSLLAWIELLKLNKENPEVIEETACEIENDVDRLNIIAIRFSKIGSMPDKKLLNLSKKIDDVCNYYEKRLPNLGGKTTIERNYPHDITIQANDILIGWVFENLIKNAAEAMEAKQGKISISISKASDKKVLILIKDTGKGMNTKTKLQIFEPGFTTKKRGWGIGLSLVKRIVEEYHNGKIYVKESAPQRGTTFAIELPSEHT